MKTFFTTKDPLESIIKDTLKGMTVQKTNHIVSGWTNIVIEASTDQGDFFFRFPRNPFWSKMIVKDATYCNFIEGKTSFYTPSMQLHYYQKCPFSVHKKIHGYSLGDRVYHLSHTALCGTAYQVAKFLKELHSIDINNAPDEVKYPLSAFLKELDQLHYSEHLGETHRFIKSSESHKTFVHGDLNLGNIIVDENDQVVGVIDFCFAGTGNPNMDLSRIISRPVPPEFAANFLSSYKELNNGHLNRSRVQKMRQVWQDIDNGYANHIREHYPEIKLPA